ncbi:MAG: hypothetical protein ACJ73D_11530, partial [Pyrinomonadaceae bacterium]
ALLIGGATVAEAQKKRVVRPKAQAAKKSGGITANGPQQNAVNRPNAKLGQKGSGVVAAQPAPSQIKKQGTNPQVTTNKNAAGLTTEYSQIITYLQKQPDCQGRNTQFKIKREIQIGVDKTAYAGVCTRPDLQYPFLITRVVVFYEIAQNGLRVLFQKTYDQEDPSRKVTTFGITTMVNKGYYDFVANLGGHFFYHWNGSQYVGGPSHSPSGSISFWF